MTFNNKRKPLSGGADNQYMPLSAPTTTPIASQLTPANFILPGSNTQPLNYSAPPTGVWLPASAASAATTRIPATRVPGATIPGTRVPVNGTLHLEPATRAPVDFNGAGAGRAPAGFNGLGTDRASVAGIGAAVARLPVNITPAPTNITPTSDDTTKCDQNYVFNDNVRLSSAAMTNVPNTRTRPPRAPRTSAVDKGKHNPDLTYEKVPNQKLSYEKVANQETPQNRSLPPNDASKGMNYSKAKFIFAHNNWHVSRLLRFIFKDFVRFLE